MTTANEAAAAAVRAHRILTGGRDPEPAVVHAMLYYAQGMSLAMTREPLFEDRFEAATQGVLSGSLSIFIRDEDQSRWVGALLARYRTPSDELLDAMRDVHEAFGGWGAHGLSCAVRRERPWLRARGDLSWTDEARPEVTRTHVHGHFAWAIENGEDAMDDLGIPKDPDGPAWLRPYAVYVSLTYSVGHPLFDQVEAVRMRTALGFGAVPEDWTGFEFGGNRRPTPAKGAVET